MDLPSKHVSHLSKKIGARVPGSDGEAAAASYILDAMGDGGIDVDMESFSSWKSDQPGIIIVLILSLASYLLFLVSHTLCLVLSIAAFLIFQMETYTWAITSRLMPRSSASNVLGRVRPWEDTFNRVVVVANYDSAKSSPLGRPFIARSYRVLYIICFVCVTLVVLLCIFGLGASYAKFDRHVLFLAWVASSPLAAYILFFCLLHLWGEVFGRFSRGANDNASGVGVMLSVISGLAVDPLEHTEVWGVATARGFAGCRGMIAFLQRHRRQMKNAYILNLDHIGAGNLNIVNREGPMLGFHSSRRLKRVAVRAAKMSEEIKVGRGNCRVKKSDAMVALVRGYRALTIGCLTGGSYLGFRHREDTYDLIERDTLDDAVELVNLVLDEIDATL